MRTDIREQPLILQTHTAVLSKAGGWFADAIVPDYSGWTLYAVQAGFNLSEPLRGTSKPFLVQVQLRTAFHRRPVCQLLLAALKDTLLLPSGLPRILAGEVFTVELVDMPDEMEGEVYVHLLYMSAAPPNL